MKKRRKMKTHSVFGRAKYNHDNDRQLLTGVHEISALIGYNLLTPYLNLTSRIAQASFLVPPFWISKVTERRNQYG